MSFSIPPLPTRSPKPSVVVYIEPSNMLGVGKKGRYFIGMGLYRDCISSFPTNPYALTPKP